MFLVFVSDLEHRQESGQQENLTWDEVSQIFKANVENEWCYIQKDTYFKFCKI